MTSDKVEDGSQLEVCTVWVFYSSWFCVSLVGGAGMGTVSWDHFFTSLNQYYIGLRQSVPHHHAAPMSGQRTITPQEVEGLRAVLHLIGAVVRQVSVSHLLYRESLYHYLYETQHLITMWWKNWHVASLVHCVQTKMQKNKEEGAKNTNWLLQSADVIFVLEQNCYVSGENGAWQHLFWPREVIWLFGNWIRIKI